MQPGSFSLIRFFAWEGFKCILAELVFACINFMQLVEALVC